MNSTLSDTAAQHIDDQACDALFRKARTHSAWLDRPVDDGLLHQIYEMMKWGPTSANCCPARILFLRTRAAKERLRPALQPANVDKTMRAPVTAVIAYDSKFYEMLSRLFPAMPGAREMFAKSQELADSTAMRNGLQGAYFMLAARSLGLDCGPMSGFDNAKVDQEFFAAAAPWTGAVDGGFIAAGPVKSNFLCNLGYGDPEKLHPRGPRLNFDEACQLL
jgi:3-hydroxypropanoate dehydrogenase